MEVRPLNETWGSGRVGVQLILPFCFTTVAPRKDYVMGKGVVIMHRRSSCLTTIT